MNRCKTCKHFVNYGNCDCEKFVDGSLESSDGIGFWTFDDQYKTYFRTGPDFGCVHWKKKDD